MPGIPSAVPPILIWLATLAAQTHLLVWGKKVKKFMGQSHRRHIRADTAIYKSHT